MVDILNELKKKDKMCTGCGACYNVCPVGAITMQEDDEGFLFPTIDANKCINCNLCKNTCPVLNTKYVNNKNPECYAMMADDLERVDSASGGFVAVIARWILKQGGCVYGAAWTRDWNVRHIRIDSVKELYKIKSSKYVQSNTNDSYIKVKNDLKSDKWVLYTGLPCQIAALYAVLKDFDINKLITIDILCHGVPSYKVLKKYLEDNYEINDIEKIDFRDKTKYGWSSSTTVHYKNGNIVRKNINNDAFYKSFLPCMSLRKSCSVCPMSKIPRQGDFTAGDYWGVEKINKIMDDKKGTSVVLVNNNKGQKLVKILKDEFKLWEKTNLNDATRINANILHPFNAHPGRKHFFSAMNIKPFNKLVDDSLNHNYDIGVVGLWYGINYGSILTYYALYNLLRKLGYDAVMLPKPCNLWEERFNNPNTIAQRFVWKHCNVFLPYKYQGEYVKFNDRCKDFIVGSDVVWNYSICGEQVDQFFFLDWIERGHKKIAYAASFGNGLDGTEEYKQKAKYYLNKFNFVSCRERSSAKEASNFTGRNDIENVLDPVFMCDIEIYEKAIEEVKNLEEDKFVFAYLLQRTYPKQKNKFLDYAERYFKAKSFVCCNPNGNWNEYHKLYGDRLLKEVSVEEWLYYMKNCEFYIGESYHALCFCLIFHKPFIIVYGKNSKNYSGARFQSLLEIVGLEKRWIDNLNDESIWKNLLEEEIDWSEVDRKLNIEKEKSLNWLKKALAEQLAELTPEDYVENAKNRKFNEQNVMLELLINDNKKIKNRFKNLNNNNNFYSKSEWIKKKIKGGIQCYKDNGLKYTVERLIFKTKNKLS